MAKQTCDFCNKNTATYRCASCGTFLCGSHTKKSAQGWKLALAAIFTLLIFANGIGLLLLVIQAVVIGFTKKHCLRCGSSAIGI
jgi:hypothetical protein